MSGCLGVWVSYFFPIALTCPRCPPVFSECHIHTRKRARNQHEHSHAAHPRSHSRLVFSCKSCCTPRRHCSSLCVRVCCAAVWALAATAPRDQWQHQPCQRRACWHSHLNTAQSKLARAQPAQSAAPALQTAAAVVADSSRRRSECRSESSLWQSPPATQVTAAPHWDVRRLVGLLLCRTAVCVCVRACMHDCMCVCFITVSFLSFVCTYLEILTRAARLRVVPPPRLCLFLAFAGGGAFRSRMVCWCHGGGPDFMNCTERRRCRVVLRPALQFLFSLKSAALCEAATDNVVL